MTEVPSLAQRTAIGATWMIAWRMVTRVLGLASTLILARILVPADFGLVAMATTFAAAVDQMSQLGLQDALVRRRGAISELLDTAFALQLGRAVLTAAVLAVAAPVAVWWFAEPRLRALLLILAAGSLVAGFENIAIAEFRRELQYGVQFKLLVAPRLLQVALTIPLALWWQSYWALLAGITIGRLARTAMTYRVHPYRPRLRAGLRLQGWRELAGFSAWTWATTLASLVWDRCDPFVLGPALGPAQLGVYLVAFEIAILPLSELIVPAADALFAGFASAQLQGTSSTRMAPLVAVSLFQVTLPLVIAISAVAGHMVVVLLGPGWMAAQPVVSIMAWLCAFSPFSFVASSVLVANGFVRRNFVANVIASAVKLMVLLVAVASTRRLAGIAEATTICVVLESAVFITLLTGTGDVRLRDMSGGLMRGMLAGSVSVAVLLSTGLGWQPVSLPVLSALLTGAGIGILAMAVFAASLLALWRVAGRPEGPETQLVRMAVSMMGLRRFVSWTNAAG